MGPSVERAGSECGPCARLLGAYLDGQLDAASTVTVDDHLGHCATCRERVALDCAIRGSLKRAVSAPAPDDVRARLLASMAAHSAPCRPPAADEAPERAWAGEGEERGRPSMLRHWRTTLPLATAAALALAWQFASEQPFSFVEATPRLGAGFGNDDLVSQFVDVHRHPLRPETPDPKAVRAFEQEVGVPVHVPQLEKNARFVGGRLLPVHGGERAAMLQYEVARANGGVHRVSLFIYDPRKVQVLGAEQLAPRAVGTAQVRVGQAHGYSVAVAQHGPVGYAVASDLEDSSAQYAVAADRD